MNGDESMDERGSTVEKTKDKVNETQKLIIEMISKIENQKYLEFIYNLLNSFKKKWGI